ncbi:hypothetical protein R1sor_001247 [Riccia sorocarpa]|uniref:Uncharacterized protein n=1 Tax=Riccia sorocarpa TaxID=122646 RepID=A0ABD3GYJ2_9MARC
MPGDMKYITSTPLLRFISSPLLRRSEGPLARLVMTTLSGLSGHLDSESDDSGSSMQPVPKAGKVPKLRGRGKIPPGTPSVQTRSQKLKGLHPANSAMSTESTHPSESRRSLWKEEASDISFSRSACASIIDKYKLTFGGKEPPCIPLCRLEVFTRVRKLQLSSAQTEELKRSFRLNSYMESCHGFHVSPEMTLCWIRRKRRTGIFSGRPQVKTSTENVVRIRILPDWSGGNSRFGMVTIGSLFGSKTSHATVQYDWIQDAERTLQVLSTPLVEYKPLLGEKVYTELEESRKKTATKGWYSDHMTITAGAYIMSYSEVMAAQKELNLLEKDMETSGVIWSEEEKADQWKKLLTSATKQWSSLIQKYATIVNPNLGPEFLFTVRELQVTLSQQEKGKRDVKVEVGVDRIKTFAAAPLPPDLKVKLLKVNYNGDVALRSRYHHPREMISMTFDPG